MSHLPEQPHTSSVTQRAFKGHQAKHFQFTVNGATRFFEDAGGIGAHEMTQSEADSYFASGEYQPFHPIGY